jgi:NADP-dependent 3-hydroxy acid dehydrogenase YdfG
MHDMEHWKNRVALVTGASSGIGRAVARELARNQMQVAVCARRADRLQALQYELEAEGAAVLAVPTDLRDETQIRQLFGKIRDQWGGTDVLVNNAAIGWQTPLLNGEVDRWRAMWEVNVLAMSICTYEAVKDMRERGDNGYVIYISSLGAHRQNPASSGNGMYVATKSAVRALAEAVRRELRALGSSIRITAISPGVVETEFHARFLCSEDAARKAYTQSKVLQPEDIASIVRYALSCPPHVQLHDVLVRPTDQVT